MSNMFVIRLIEEVKKRPAIWDKRHDTYHRTGMDSEWSNLAVVLKRNKEDIRQKWRNLRDQFQREYRKVILPKDHDGQNIMDFYKGKWAHFEMLLFLKDTMILRPRTDSNTSVEEEFEVKYEPYSPVHSVDSFKETDGLIEPMNNTDEPRAELVILSTEGARKRKAAECEEVEEKNIKNSEELDEDLCFAKSLVPFFKRLTPIKKLMIRNEIQSIFLRELLSEEQNGRRSCGSSSKFLMNSFLK